MENKFQQNKPGRLKQLGKSIFALLSVIVSSLALYKLLHVVWIR